MNSDAGMTQREKQAESFGSFLDVVPVVDRLTAETRQPRSWQSLLDLAETLGTRPEHFVLDAGSGEGAWVTRLRDRFGCNVIALDLTHSGLIAVTKKGFTLQEFYRILKPGGGVALYVALTTPELEPRERARLLKALDMPSWWDGDNGAVDEAIRAAGFEVITRELISPEYTERALMDRDNETIDDFAMLGRLRRERARFEAEMGTVWYERWVGWMQWSLYLLLGKIQTIAWTLRKPVP